MPAVTPQRWIAYIMAAVFVWGSLLALGAYLYGGPRQAVRAGIIFGCMFAFLAFWAILLRYRAGKTGDASNSHEKPA
jgi:hypothetical protein